jgi:DNA-binding CsgD family transcriptional regulator
MRYRPATQSDIAAVASKFRGRNALPLEPRVRAALPVLLQQLIASPASTLTLFEERTGAGPELISFAGGLFLQDAVIENYLAHPYPGLLPSVLAALLDGRGPLMSLEEIRLANSNNGLALAVFPMPLGSLEWSSPLVAQLRRLAPQSFVRYYAGYRLRAIYYEVFTDEVADYLRAGGYQLLYDFSAAAGTGFMGVDCRARMMRLTRAELPPGAMSMATQMFDPPAAKLGLTPAEQRVVLHALDGASDRALAETLHLSSETVRSNWRSIYRRLAGELTEIDAISLHGDHATRGLEKRRIAIEYFRQNMQELRPSLPMARSQASSWAYRD